MLKWVNLNGFVGNWWFKPAVDYTLSGISRFKRGQAAFHGQKTRKSNPLQRKTVADPKEALKSFFQSSFALAREQASRCMCLRSF